MTSTTLLRGTDRRDQAAFIKAMWDGGQAVWVVDPETPRRRLLALGGGLLSPVAVDLLLADGRATVDLDVPDDTAAIVTTSGTTGVPRALALTAAALDASAAGAHAHLAVTLTDRWLLALPLHHVAGLSVLWRSRAIGHDPVVQQRLDVAAANDAGATMASLVPTQLRRLIDAGSHLTAQVLLGGGAISSTLLAATAAGGHVAGVTRSYGMTETAGGCVFDGAPFADVEVSLRHGRLAIRGPVLAAGQVTSHGMSPIVDGDGWLVTNDLGDVAPDGVVSVVGRIDDVIITGGAKVGAASVEVVLADHPAIDAAGVVGLPDDEWGQVVTAAIVLVAGRPRPDDDQLRTLVSAELGPKAAPRRIIVVDDLPLTALGKVARRRLSARLAASLSDA